MAVIAQHGWTRAGTAAAGDCSDFVDGSSRQDAARQCRDRKEADIWEKAVIDYPFNGRAFAGALRLDPFEVCRRVIRLMNAGKINEKQNHLHVLGTGRLDMAVFLTALQNALRKRVCPSIVITFDSSSPNLLLRGYRAASHADLSNKNFLLRSGKIPRTHEYIGSNAMFPFRSSGLGRKLLIGDLCAGEDCIKRANWDALTVAMVINHNLNALLEAIVAANSIVTWKQLGAEQLAPI